MNIKKVVIRVALALFIFCGTMTFIHSNIGVCYASSTTYGDRIDTGLCGNNLTWTVYDSDNNSTGDTLVISGTGAMEDYKKSRDDRDDPWEYSTPWIAKNFPLKKVVLENGLTHIGNCAFIDRSGLTDSLVIPDSVTSIGCSAFENCSGLTDSLVIPDSVTSIGCSAFENCSGLTGSLVIPNSVTSIGYNAFSGCSGFNGTLTISNKLKTIDSKVFYQCAGLTGSLIIPDSVTNIGNSAFSECSGLTGSLIIPDSVTSIGYNAFYRCTGLEGELILPDKVERIESNTFRECGKLSVSLILPKNLTYIGEYAFAGTGFKTISDFPESLVSILDSAFYGCKTLSGNLVIPSNVQELGYGAFEGCHKLLSITVKNPNCTFVKERDRPAITYNDLPKIVWKGYCKSTLVTYAEGIRGNYEISHQWNTEESICKEATCTEKGIQGIQCSRCNEIKSGSEKDILPTGHTAVTDNAVAPTCTSIGLTEGSHCSICNDILVKQNEIEAIGHLYTEYVSNGDATCLDDGTETAVCKNNCGTTDTRTEKGSKLGHSFGNWTEIQPPNCVNEGSEQHVCSRCNTTETRSIQATGHVWENAYTIDRAATCNEEGSESIHCSTCDAIKDSSIREISATGHVKEVHDGKAATCTKAGWKAYETCKNCDYSTYKEIAALGHKSTVVKGYAATCTKAGKTDGTKCSVCGSVIKAQQTIPPTHKVSKWKTTKKATVLKTGQKKGKCSVCKKTVKQTIAKVPATIKVSSYVSVKYKKSKTIKVKYKKGDGIKSWSSNNKKVATVTKKGKVTGKSKGTAILTVKLKSGKTAKVTVTVK